MKKLILPMFLLVLSQVALADTDMMGFGMGYGMMGGMSWMSLWGLLYLAVGAFIVSVIFWLTYNWLVKSKKRK